MTSEDFQDSLRTDRHDADEYEDDATALMTAEADSLRHFTHRLGTPAEEMRAGLAEDAQETGQVFYVTFGVQYSHEPHPSIPEAHPDGWVEIVAPDYDAARAVAFDRIGQAWAFLYDADDFRAAYHPLGCLRRIEAVS